MERTTSHRQYSAARKALGTAVLTFVVLTILPSAAASQDGEAVAAEQQEVPLYDNLGDLHRPISTEVPDAQAYFDQGLRLYYAFNHQEAIHSFRRAQQLDPTCAMCWWGEAIAWGPNINLPMDSASGVAAHQAIQQALSRAENADEKERALIDALSLRYEPEPPADRAHLDEAYAGAMEQLANRYPEDDDVVVLHGEAVMDLRPWDYWTAAGELQPGMAGAIANFERVLERNPDHPGACHFFIHAVEKEQPERAVPCAERLAELMPGAGHIVHMPGHIYIRVGRYVDAIEANVHATHADESWIQDRRPGMGVYTAGYYPHNYDFLAFAALMAGKSEQAVDAAEQLRTLIPEEMFGAPGMTFLQHYSMRSLLVRTRFAQWEEILAAPEPEASHPHARGIWHYARGRALAATEDIAGAKAALESLRALAGGPELAGVTLNINEAQEILGIAAAVLAGRIAEAEGRYDQAIVHLEDAAVQEDALLYGEPPDWTVPVRQELGEVLLADRRWSEAEETFRELLNRFPDNGWSLAGLARALEGQGRTEEAERVRQDFERVWREADVALET